MLTTGVDLAEHDLLELVVERQHTGTSNTTEDVSTSTLEERLHALLGNDLRASVEHGLVVNTRAGSHHHATTVGIVSDMRNKTKQIGHTGWYREGRKQDQHQW